ncbi:hypothetical protein F5Y19DRAFT_87085 [Xylariaceae sp. FL1651]|nr:hypothetical protein F5Y19DRAFT_87085 [Xylariaceae sp. FL1651]
MTTIAAGAMESPLNITITGLSSPEPELQRGRKRRRDLLDVSNTRTQIPSGGSATFRGRCRHRSSSRCFDMSSLSRPTSQHQLLIRHHRNTSASLSPSRRKVLRIMQRSRSPSRSRSPCVSYNGMAMVQDAPKRRRQRSRTQSPSRNLTNMPMGLDINLHGGTTEITAMEAIVLLAAHQEVVPGERSAAEDSIGRG